MTENTQSPVYELQPDETTTQMMFYTDSGVTWGHIIHNEHVLPSRILVGLSIPDFITVFNAQTIFAEPNMVSKPVVHREMYIPVQKIIAYHVQPPLEDKLDYDPTEPSRIMAPINIYLGAFVFSAKMRVSEKASIKTSLEVSKSEFITVYDLEVKHPGYANMKPIKVNMAYIRLRQNLYVIP